MKQPRNTSEWKKIFCVDVFKPGKEVFIFSGSESICCTALIIGRSANLAEGIMYHLSWSLPRYESYVIEHNGGFALQEKETGKIISVFFELI